MAKILVTIVIVLLVAIGLFVGCSTLLVKIVSDVTDTRTYEVDNTEVCVRGGKAYIRSFRWNGDMNNTDIYFPSTVNDTEKNKELTITGIGGIYGSGSPVQCHIEFTEDVPKDERDREKDIPTEHEQIILTVHVSPSIEDVLGLEGGRYFTYNEDGSRVSHDIYYFIECDENNEKLYSKDGKLYYRDGDMQESHIDYVPDEEEQQTENSSETIESVIASENIPINTETDSKADRFGSKVASEKPTEVVETTTAAEPEETAAEPEEIENVSDIDENVEKAYEEILSFYRDTLQNAGEYTAVNEEELKTPLLQFGANGMLDVNEVGWLYHDIDGNGTPELFITYYGVPRDLYIYNTVKEEAALALGCSDGENLDIYSNGLVCTSFMVTEDNTIEHWYRMNSKTGLLLSVAENDYYFDENGQNTAEYYIYAVEHDHELFEENYCQHDIYPVWAMEWGETLTKEEYEELTAHGEKAELSEPFTLVS